MIRIFTSALGMLLIYVLILAGSAPFVGCTKTIYDTIYQRDTIVEVKRDTICLQDTSLCSDLTRGLIAYYPFTNGSLKDSSGNNNHIYSNTAVSTADRFGVSGNAYDFNALNHMMRIKNSATLNPQLISIVSIVKPRAFYTGNCHNNQVLGKGLRDDVNGFYYMRMIDVGSTCTVGQPIQADKEYFYSGFGDNYPMGSGAIAGSDTSFIILNQWYTVVYTFDGVVSRIYVNGQLKNDHLQRTTFNGNTADLIIGRHESATFPYNFNGIIDEVRIYDRALCPEQVTALSRLKQ